MSQIKKRGTVDNTKRKLEIVFFKTNNKLRTTSVVAKQEAIRSRRFEIIYNINKKELYNVCIYEAPTSEFGRHTLLYQFMENPRLRAG